jgi:hypothetical protein
MYIFISEEQRYKYDLMRKPVWVLHGLKYGDWTTQGTQIQFIEFPISDV